MTTPTRCPAPVTSAVLFGILASLSFAPAQAGCEPAGTSKADTIVCSESDTRAVMAGAGDDRVTVLSGAAVNVQAPDAAPVAIDAGSGHDIVLNHGTVTLSWGSAPTNGAGRCGEWGPARGAYGASGADRIENFGSLIVSGLFRAPAESTRSAGWGTNCTYAPVYTAIGIEGGEHSDDLVNHGTLNVSATLEPESAVFRAGDTPPSMPTGLSASGSDGASAVGMAGGSGSDKLINDGTLDVAATSNLAGATADARGLVGGHGGSELVNRGALTVTATSTEGGAASAIGIEAGNGKDTVDNEGALTVKASAKLTSLTKSVALFGGDEVTATTAVESRAAGIEAGNGRDRIENSGTVSVDAYAGIKSGNVELNLIDTSHSDASTGIRSVATGVDGGNGPDAVAIGNTGAISAHASAESASLSVELNAVDAATGDAQLTVAATATGVAGGRGPDKLENAGTVTAEADATLTEFGLNASFADFTIADRQGSNLSTRLDATAVAVDLGRAKDEVETTSSGSLRAEASADALSIGVALASEGVPGSTEILFETGGLASIGITSNSYAYGYLGGTGKDRLNGAGSITASSTSDATQASINVGVAIFDFKLPTPGLVLGSAGTASNALASGVDTGQGNDAVTNAAAVDVGAEATADATTVSVNIAELSVDFLPGVPGVPVGASLVVADTATEADARASGIATGVGNDTLTNEGAVDSNAVARSGSISAAATLNTKFKEGDNFFTLNAVAARGVTRADADAVGLDTGDGKDDVGNDGTLTVGATADALAVGIGVDVAGTVRGKGGALSAALTDSSSEAEATAAGIRAGEGDDAVVNDAAVSVTADADVIGISGSVTAGIARQGLVAGAALARSESIATAEAVGIDGGTGADAMVNSGALNARAIADADAVSVSATVEGATQGLVGGAALVDTGTTATASAVGIHAGREADGAASATSGKSGCHSCDPRETVTHTGAISVDAEADTDAVGVSANVGIVTKDGVALGAALARTSANAGATAIGIAADDAATIANEGSIGLRSLANADAVSVSLDVEGTARGLTAGAALVDATVTASGTAVGIATGAGGRCERGRGADGQARRHARRRARRYQRDRDDGCERHRCRWRRRCAGQRRHYRAFGYLSRCRRGQRRAEPCRRARRGRHRCRARQRRQYRAAHEHGHGGSSRQGRSRHHGRDYPPRPVRPFGRRERLARPRRLRAGHRDRRCPGPCRGRSDGERDRYERR